MKVWNINKPQEGVVSFYLDLPPDLINYEELFNRVNTLIKCVELARVYMEDLLATLQERSATSLPAGPPAAQDQGGS